MALLVGVSLAFPRSLLKVSTKRSAWPLLLRWYGAIVICSTQNVWQNSLNSLDMNWLPLFETMQSTTPNRANNSCKKLITTSVIAFFASKNFRPFWKAVYYNQVVETIQGTSKIDMNPWPRSVGFWPEVEFYGRCLCHQSKTFYCILDVPVHIFPIGIASHEAFPPRYSGMTDMKFFLYSFLQCCSYNNSITVHNYFITDWVNVWNLSVFIFYFVFISFIKSSSNPFSWISPSVKGSSLTMLHNVFFYLNFCLLGGDHCVFKGFGMFCDKSRQSVGMTNFWRW